ncbi:hypothetical protein GGS23DRAFT_240557 [Durotheca rogersii]|uniref:uncharacterized protein n=1 Tax=Durotheca rogersii TaxID=419775 RepID=UPI00221F270F|nr:uncharacterized protein GGS23DRAFT_240557 [Durotheca rogersii]KAI5860227.1 hypothetical protein GGS23DRAFT_240557 [Durotheca rogersii]
MGTFLFKWAHPASEVYVTGTFDDWKKTEKLEKVGDHFEKTVTLPDASAKIFYKVRCNSLAFTSRRPLALPGVALYCVMDPSPASSPAPSFFLSLSSFPFSLPQGFVPGRPRGARTRACLPTCLAICSMPCG